MKVRKKINWGIVLFFLLAVLVAGICIADMVTYSSRKQSAEDRAKLFVTELSAVFTWPDELPVTDQVEFDRNVEKYLASLDPKCEKLKPYLFDSNAVKDEIKAYARTFMIDFLYDGVAPKQVSFTPVFNKTLISKGMARIDLNVSSRIKLSDGKTTDRVIPASIMMEEYNGEWVVVDLYWNE